MFAATGDHLYGKHRAVQLKAWIQLLLSNRVSAGRHIRPTQLRGFLEFLQQTLLPSRGCPRWQCSAGPDPWRWGCGWPDRSWSRCLWGGSAHCWSSPGRRWRDSPDFRKRIRRIYFSWHAMFSANATRNTSGHTVSSISNVWEET